MAKKVNRKHGRNKATCLAYRNSNRREINKALRLMRHLRTRGGSSDEAASEALSKMSPLAVQRAKHQLARQRGEERSSAAA